MYTYIMKSQGLYKIGKAIDVNARLKGFQCGNPYIELIKIIQGNHERKLHQLYKEKRVRGEWFSLTEEDVNNIQVPEKEIPNLTNVPIDTRLIDYIIKNQNHASIVTLSAKVLEILATEWQISKKQVSKSIQKAIDNDIIHLVGMGHYKYIHGVKIPGKEERKPKIRLWYNNESDQWEHEWIKYPDEQKVRVENEMHKTIQGFNKLEEELRQEGYID